MYELCWIKLHFLKAEGYRVHMNGQRLHCEAFGSRGALTVMDVAHCKAPAADSLGWKKLRQPALKLFIYIF